MDQLRRGVSDFGSPCQVCHLMWKVHLPHVLRTIQETHHVGLYKIRTIFKSSFVNIVVAIESSPKSL